MSPNQEESKHRKDQIEHAHCHCDSGGLRRVRARDLQSAQYSQDREEDADDEGVALSAMDFAGEDGLHLRRKIVQGKSSMGVGHEGDLATVKEAQGLCD